MRSSQAAGSESLKAGFGEDQTNLVALVALLVSTAGFKDELSHISLGDTPFTLLTVFVLASVAFGSLLYIHVVINAWILLLKACRQKKRSAALVVLRFLFLATLMIIPCLTILAASSAWLKSQTCTTIGSDPFGFPGASESNGTIVCHSELVGEVLPALLSLAPLVVFGWLMFRRGKSLRHLSPELRSVRLQIRDYRVLQAVTSDVQKVNTLQKVIDDLEAEFNRKSQVK